LEEGKTKHANSRGKGKNEGEADNSYSKLKIGTKKTSRMEKKGARSHQNSTATYHSVERRLSMGGEWIAKAREVYSAQLKGRHFVRGGGGQVMARK